MAKYFMIGTKYESFERMMMSPDRRARDIPSERKSPHPMSEMSERNNLPFPMGERVESFTKERSK